MARFIIPGYDFYYNMEQFTFDDQTGEIVETEDYYIISQEINFGNLPYNGFDKMNAIIDVISGEDGNRITTLAPMIHYFKWERESIGPKVNPVSTIEPMVGMYDPIWLGCAQLNNIDEYVNIPSQATSCAIVLKAPTLEEENVYFLLECQIMNDSLSQMSEGRIIVPKRPDFTAWNDYVIIIEPSVYQLMSIHGYQDSGGSSGGV